MLWWMNTQEDERQRQDWLSRDPKDYAMETEELIYMAVHGFECCPSDCNSRSNCGEDECYGVRTTFATSDHYHLYLQLRDLAKKLTALAFINSKIQQTGKHDAFKTEGDFYEI
jgi:hypothetical protein